MNKLIVFIVCICLLSIPSVLFSKENTTGPKVFIDGEEFIFDTPPINNNGRILVPIRGIFEVLGIHVYWDKNTKMITTDSELNDIKIKMTVGRASYEVSGKKLEMDAFPTIINNRTLVPIRFMVDYSGAEVTWDANKKAVIISRFRSSAPVYYYSETRKYVNLRSLDVDVTRELVKASETRPFSEKLYNTANDPNNITMTKLSDDDTIVQIAKYNNGNEYIGTLRNGLRHGKGKLTSHIYNFIYEGEFFEDYMFGQGKIDYTFGESYTGGFKYDEYDGYGVYTRASGTTLEGVWKSGELITPQ